MSGNSTAAPPLDITQFLPPSLNLPPHLSAHKYFFVCTLTVAAWDTLVLSPRTWRLFKTPEWPPLKIIFHVLRILMPAEFVIVAVAFFDTKFTQSVRRAPFGRSNAERAQMCSNFYLFEPIVTGILVVLCSVVHAIRIYAINDKNTALLGLMGAGVLAEVAAMATSVAFFRCEYLCPRHQSVPPAPSSVPTQSALPRLYPRFALITVSVSGPRFTRSRASIHSSKHHRHMLLLLPHPNR